MKKFYSIIFMVLSIGLTLVSLNAGFLLYTSLFSISTAILICVVFELLRLSTLYSISVFKSWSKIIVLFLYLSLACTCFFASVLSLDSQIIQKHNQYIAEIEQEVEKDLYLIKSEYSKKFDIELEKLYIKKDEFQQKLARNRSSKYYPERIKNTDEAIEKIIKERDDLLNSISFGKITKEQIQSHKAILGLENIQGTYDLNNLSPFEQAANELLNIDVVTLQKFIGYALAFSVEAGILLLALLSFFLQKDNKSEIIVTKNEIEKLIEDNEDKDIKKVEEEIQEINHEIQDLEDEILEKINQNQNILKNDEKKKQSIITYIRKRNIKPKIKKRKIKRLIKESKIEEDTISNDVELVQSVKDEIKENVNKDKVEELIDEEIEEVNDLNVPGLVRVKKKKVLSQLGRSIDYFSENGIKPENEPIYKEIEVKQ